MGRPGPWANTNELNLFVDMELTCRANFAGSLRHNYGNATYIINVHLGIFRNNLIVVLCLRQ